MESQNANESAVTLTGQGNNEVAVSNYYPAQNTNLSTTQVDFESEDDFESLADRMAQAAANAPAFNAAQNTWTPVQGQQITFLFTGAEVAAIPNKKNPEILENVPFVLGYRLVVKDGKNTLEGCKIAATRAKEFFLAVAPDKTIVGFKQPPRSMWNIECTGTTPSKKNAENLIRVLSFTPLV